MEASFWHERWKLNQIGFHIDNTNPLLTNHIGKLNLSKNSRIFLPLCGKTLDIAYLLDQGFSVVGIELSEVAVTALFNELNVKPEIATINSLKIYKAENINIFVGDFFDLNAELLGDIDAIYDRASLIALPVTMRQDYTKHLTKITQNTQQLLICLEYDQAAIKGPPFSISADEVKQHYENIYSIQCAESNSINNGKLQNHNATENAWILKNK